MNKVKETTQNFPFLPESSLDTQQKFSLPLSILFRNIYCLKGVEN